MTREELEHLIRAAAEVTNEYEFVVVNRASTPRLPFRLPTKAEAHLSKFFVTIDAALPGSCREG